MKTRLLEIVPSKRKDKRLTAVFEVADKNNQPILKKIHFGAKNGKTFIDHADEKLRENYIKRHSGLKEDFTNPLTAGSLSMHILWGESSNIEENIEDFKNIFKLH